MDPIYTIGHSNHDTKKFCERLQRAGIELVVDVRSAPYSRYVPQFNKKEIEQSLLIKKFEYRFAGDHIGGKPTNPALLDEEGHGDYEKIARTKSFIQGLDRLEQLRADPKRICLMCAEEDPRFCHRHLLIARQLELERAIAVIHLRADGTMLRALDLLKAAPRQMSLFK